MTSIVLIGYRQCIGVRRFQTRVWCDFCCVWHVHGSSEPGDLRHRAAHCFAADSPYRAGGYWIHTARAAFAGVAPLVRAAGPSAQDRMMVGRITPGIARLRQQRVPFVHRIPVAS